jgi:hypothetical protein
MKNFSILLLAITLSYFSNAQVSRIATSPSAIATQIPGYSEVSTINTKTVSYTPSTPPADPTPVDDDTTTEDNKLYRYADILPVTVSMSDGNITSTSAGKVWTVRISIPNALNIGFAFSQFDLTPTAQMYIFNEARTVLDNGIKKSNFASTTLPGIAPFRGNSIIIYIIEPGNFGAFQSVVSIQNLEAGFQEIDDVGDIVESNRLMGLDCDPMIQCQPAKLPSARAVAVMYFYGHRCTGTLLNNEANNGRAFFLTAFHCVDVSGGLFPNWGNGTIDPIEHFVLRGARFQFRFWRTTCNGNVNNSGLTFTGAEVRGASKGTDVALLELLNQPGVGDGVNYAGWNRQTNLPADNYSYIIHHPRGADMRITNTTSVTHFFWNEQYWKARYSSGTVTKGSSGSALFNESDQVVGQLSQGWSNCDHPNNGDRYGKFYHSWNGAGLAPWLSPSGNQSSGPLILSTVTMVGPDNISCNTNATYSVPNLLGCIYTWSVSSDLTIVSGQGTSSIVVTKSSPGPSSNGLVSVAIEDSKGFTRNVTVSKNVTVGGSPNIVGGYYSSGGSWVPLTVWGGDPFDIENTVCFTGMPTSTNTNMEIWNASSIVWTKVFPTTPNGVTWSQSSGNAAIVFKTTGQTIGLRVTATNGCGSSEKVYAFKTVSCAMRQMSAVSQFTVSPNPASSVAVVSVVDNRDMAIRKQEVSNFSEIRIYDALGKMRKYQKFNKVRSASINLSGLNNGIYIVEISSAAHKEKHRLVIQK